MPIDLSQAGSPCPYPPRAPRFLTWLGIWVMFAATGAAISIWTWPTGTLARGALFWWRTLGFSNLAFLTLLGVVRMGYDMMWMRAHRWNAHVHKRMDVLVREAQRPLQVLGVSHSLPLPEQAVLATALCTGKPLFGSRAPRTGLDFVIHNRFDEESLSEIPLESASRDDVADPEGETTAQSKTETVPTLVLKMVDALLPLAESLHGLSQYGPQYAPVVHVLARPETAAERISQAKDALRRVGLAHLECEPGMADTPLMEADTWLDRREWRPLLVMAAEWHDANPPVNSTEGCVAVLLNPGCFTLPEPVSVAGLLHRPLVGDTDAMGDLFTNALIWGDTNAQAVNRVWLTGLGGEHDTALLAAFKAASLAHLGDKDAQRRPDRVIGVAAAINPWLSIAAAIGSGEPGAHFIVDHAQAAVLHVFTTSHDKSVQ